MHGTTPFRGTRTALSRAAARPMLAPMPLKLIAGPPNSGRTGAVLERFRAAAGRDPVLVVPTGDDVERFERELTSRRRAGDRRLGLHLRPPLRPGRAGRRSASRASPQSHPAPADRPRGGFAGGAEAARGILAAARLPGRPRRADLRASGGARRSGDAEATRGRGGAVRARDRCALRGLRRGPREAGAPRPAFACGGGHIGTARESGGMECAAGLPLRLRRPHGRAAGADPRAVGGEQRHHRPPLGGPRGADLGPGRAVRSAPRRRGAWRSRSCAASPDSPRARPCSRSSAASASRSPRGRR